MFIFGELIRSLALLISMIFNIIYFLLVIRIILSWVGADTYNEIVAVIYRITDPILAPLQRLPLRVGMIDFSPVIAFIILSVAKDFIIRILYQMAQRLS